MSETGFVQPPGCAGWPIDEVRPTAEEASHSLLDLSDADNARKLARAIAARNTMEQAGWLVGEIGYAFQNYTFDCAAIEQCVFGVDEYDPVIAALEPLCKSNAIAENFVYALKSAKELEQGKEAA